MPVPIAPAALAAMLLAAAAAAQARFPAPPTPPGNPITTEKALLGMALFWEEQLSSSNTVACGSCHGFGSGGTDGRAGTRAHPGPDGIYGTADDKHGSPSLPRRAADGRYAPEGLFGLQAQVTTRRAPTVINAAWHQELFYDGRAGNGPLVDPVTGQTVLASAGALEHLVLQPPVNPAEMAHVGRTWSQVIDKLRGARPLALASAVPERLRIFLAGRSYPALFGAAFGSEEVTAGRVAMAIATYLRTLVADDSRFDRFVAGVGTLSPTETLGLQLFSAPAGNAASCVSCHADVSFESHRTGPRTVGQIAPYYGPVQNYANIGVRPIAEDPGRQGGSFKVPALRNVGLYTRYFHNGGAVSLAEVVDFYDRGGDFHVGQHTGIRPRNHTAAEKAALVAFLQALTDPRVASGVAPFDQPVLGAQRGDLLPVEYGLGMVGRDQRTARAIGLDPVFVGNPAATVGLTDVPRGLPVFALWDLVPNGLTLFGLRLEIGLGALSMVGIGATTGPSAAQGSASLAFPVPPHAGLAGTRAYLQWLLLDPALPLGAYTSTGLAVTIH